MHYVECPAHAPFDVCGKLLFLAGGITNCWNWQERVKLFFAEQPGLILYNPRRADFPINDPTAAEQQIRWEYRYLMLTANSTLGGVLVWFPHETLCPIVLFELGILLATRGSQLFIGTHPDYARRQDVVIQTKLRRPALRVHDDLDALCKEVAAWCEEP